jgi:hypothetical protein
MWWPEGSNNKVEPAAGTKYGDFTNKLGIDGQNMKAADGKVPTEKVFDNHVIVKPVVHCNGTPIPMGYYDPSYGVKYSNESDFESSALTAYVRSTAVILPDGDVDKHGFLTYPLSATPPAPAERPSIVFFSFDAPVTQPGSTP